MAFIYNEWVFVPTVTPEQYFLNQHQSTTQKVSHIRCLNCGWDNPIQRKNISGDLQTLCSKCGAVYVKTVGHSQTLSRYRHPVLADLRFQIPDLPSSKKQWGWHYSAARSELSHQNSTARNKPSHHSLEAMRIPFLLNPRE